MCQTMRSRSRSPTKQRFTRKSSARKRAQRSRVSGTFRSVSVNGLWFDKLTSMADLLPTDAADAMRARLQAVPVQQHAEYFADWVAHSFKSRTAPFGGKVLTTEEKAAFMALDSVRWRDAESGFEQLNTGPPVLRRQISMPLEYERHSIANYSIQNYLHSSNTWSQRPPGELLKEMKEQGVPDLPADAAGLLTWIGDAGKTYSAYYRSYKP